jgi:hypothetical protein
MGRITFAKAALLTTILVGLGYLLCWVLAAHSHEGMSRHGHGHLFVVMLVAAVAARHLFLPESAPLGHGLARVASLVVAVMVLATWVIVVRVYAHLQFPISPLQGTILLGMTLATAAAVEGVVHAFSSRRSG